MDLFHQNHSELNLTTTQEIEREHLQSPLTPQPQSKPSMSQRLCVKGFKQKFNLFGSTKVTDDYSSNIGQVMAPLLHMNSKSVLINLDQHGQLLPLPPIVPDVVITPNILAIADTECQAASIAVSGFMLLFRPQRNGSTTGQEIFHDSCTRSL
jgi:hypothetical protein